MSYPERPIIGLDGKEIVQANSNKESVKHVQSNFIIGNVGQEPELKQIGTGQVCNFSVAVSNNYLDKQGNKQQKTEWFNVSAFGKLAEVCANYCKKGKQVSQLVRLKTNKWEDKKR